MVEHNYRERFLLPTPNKEALKHVLEACEKGQLHPVVEGIVEVALSENPRIHPVRQETAIVIEGGGVAGVVSGYEAGALEILGWEVFGRDIVDCVGLVVGSSSGSANAAYLVNQRAIFGKSTYETHFSIPPFLNNPFRKNWPFLNPRTFLTLVSRGMVDVSYLIEFMRQDKVSYSNRNLLDTRLCVVATRVDPTLPGTPEARTVRLENFENNGDFLGALEASLTVPFASRLTPKIFRGMRLFDGGLVEHIPTKTAVDSGYTRILALTSKPVQASKARQQLSVTERGIATAYKLLDSGLAELWLSRKERAQQTRSWLYNCSMARQKNPVFATLVAPAKVDVPTFTSNQDVIRAGGIEGARSLFEAFGIKDPRIQHGLLQKLLSIETTGV